MSELNKIYNIDNVEGLQVYVPDNFIDLTVTSPPYDNLRFYKGYSFEFENVAKELYRVTKNGGVVVWIVSDETKDFCESMTSFKQAMYFKELGFKLLDTMIYYKQNYAPAYPTLRRYANQFEYMFVFVKGKKPNVFNPVQREKKDIRKTHKASYRQKDGTLVHRTIDTSRETKDASNVWEYASGGNYSTKDKIAFQHPAILPEKLAEEHILSWSNEGDIILDPFMGSGTTAKMAALNNRKYIGFEISEEYCKITEERLNNLIL